jgi:hypothetical protein
MMEKKFEQAHRGVGIWYDEGHNFWRSETGLKARDRGDLVGLIDREIDKVEPISCIMVEIRPSHAAYCKVLEVFDNGNLRVENSEGKTVTMPPGKFYKNTPENRAILNEFVENGKKMRELAEKLERL